MAGNPYELEPQNNSQTDNRINLDPSYPILAHQPYPPIQQPYQPAQQSYQPNQQPYHSNQQAYPPSPLQPQGQQIGTNCPNCNQLTNSYTKKAIGGITWLWCFVLWFFTGLCCWIPFVCDDCKEEQIRCTKCHAKKAII